MLTFLKMLGLACLMAAAYGALHNQVSFTIGPDYFHHLKFAQFGISPGVPDRLGAALVGAFASWWMGLVIGLPLATAAMFIRAPDRARMRAFGIAALVVLAVTLGLGLASLALPLPPEAAEMLPVPEAAPDPDGFRRAAMLHGVSYLAGIIGLLAGLVVMGLAILRSRRG